MNSLTWNATTLTLVLGNPDYPNGKKTRRFHHVREHATPAQLQHFAQLIHRLNPADKLLAVQVSTEQDLELTAVNA